jgi:hypothetical protein
LRHRLTARVGERYTGRVADLLSVAIVVPFFALAA